jgi:hypothetical protein
MDAMSRRTDPNLPHYDLGYVGTPKYRCAATVRAVFIAGRWRPRRCSRQVKREGDLCWQHHEAAHRAGDFPTARSGDDPTYKEWTP